jgi:peptide/nickel transport system permease protein
LTRYVLRRLAQSLIVVIGMSVLVFSIIHAIPGDPVTTILFGGNATPEQVEELRTSLNLDKPLYVQYLLWAQRALQGNLGRSFQTDRAVTTEIAQRLPSTLELTAAAMAVAVTMGLGFGALAATRRNSWIDRASMGAAFIWVAIPYFWLAILLVLFFSVRLRWFPALDDGTARSLVLPAFSLGAAYAAITARLLRNRLIGVYGEDYIRTARARGLSGGQLLRRHALRNAAIPVVTILGLQVGSMLSGAVLIEVIFGRPGIGSYLVSGLLSKDIPVVQGVLLFVGVAYLLMNVIVDVSYALLDPRIRSRYGKPAS